MKKRELISRLAVKSGIVDALGYAQRFGAQKLTILAYHRVMAIDPENYPFDLSLVSATPQDFEWQLNYVLKRFTPIQFDDVISYIDRSVPLPKRPIIITFDDGFDDNYHTVFPIAKKYSIPYSVFLSTDYVGSDDTFWFEKLAYLCYRNSSDRIVGSGYADYHLGTSIEDRRNAYYGLVEKIKYLPHDTRVNLLNDLFDRYAYVFGQLYSQERHFSRPMTWEHAREMAGWGVEFGGHGASHSILTTMSDAQMKEEIEASRNALKGELGKTPRIFSYPNGLAGDYSPELQALLRDEGYDLSVSYVPGAIPLQRLAYDRFFLRRIHMDAINSRHVQSFMLNFPDRLI